MWVKAPRFLNTGRVIPTAECSRAHSRTWGQELAWLWTSEHQYSRSRTGRRLAPKPIAKRSFYSGESQERFARYLDGSRNRCVRHRVRFGLTFSWCVIISFLLARRKMSFALIGILKRSPPYRVQELVSTNLNVILSASMLHLFHAH